MPKKIAMTGGPCSGKTTILAYLSERLWDFGLRPFIIPEMATLLISGGMPDINEIAIHNKRLYQEIERTIFLLQHNHETRIEFLAKQCELIGGRSVLLCDRGNMDVRTYLSSDDEFKDIFQSAGYENEHQVREGYDAVIYLVTAAKGAEAYYTLANNPARREKTLEDARMTDDRTLDAWKDHSHLTIIDNINSRDFEHKKRRTLQAVLNILGIPESVERERKFLLVHPSVLTIPELQNTKESRIEQMYLVSGSDERVRIRKRTFDAMFSLYYKTRKRFVRSGENIEIEHTIHADEFQLLSAQQKPDTRVIQKTRRCFVYKDHRFEIDVFSSPLGISLLEVELADLDEKVELPPFLKIIKEVTDDPRYSNYNLAHLS